MHSTLKNEDSDFGLKRLPRDTANARDNATGRNIIAVKMEASKLGQLEERRPGRFNLCLEENQTQDQEEN